MDANSAENYKKLYYNQIRQKLNERIRETGLTQKELAEACNKRHVNATQGSISKLLNESGESVQSMSLITVAALCAILELDMNGVLAVDSEQAEKGGGAAHAFDKDYILSSDTLISDPSHTAFKGYVDITLDCYFYPTISYQTELIKGTLTFAKDMQA